VWLILTDQARGGFGRSPNQKLESWTTALMKRSIPRSIHAMLLTAGAMAAVIAPTVGCAQVLESDPEEVRSLFEHAGFEVTPATYWWAGNVSTFTVHETGGDNWPPRVVMVLVYGDDEASQAARRQAEAPGILVPGYGEAAWLGNMALVQSDLYELSRLEQEAMIRGVGLLSGDSMAAKLAQRGVDGEFVALLRQAQGLVDL
jgi:hypothetical protein